MARILAQSSTVDPDPVDPDPVDPDLVDTGPGRTGPGHTGPGHTGPGHTGPGHTGPVDHFTVGNSMQRRIDELRQRVQRMQGSGVSRSLPVLPALDGLVRLQTGCAYAVDSPALAMALLAGPSRSGEWCGIVNAPDFGYEAAAAFGVDLDRTVAVPAAGEHWLSVTAGLVEVATVVLVRPPARVSEQQAARLRSRLQQKDATLIAWGDWPRCQQRVSIRRSEWTGLGQGYGRLTGRQVEVAVTSAFSAPATATIWLPDTDQQVRRLETEPVHRLAVRAG